MASTTSSSPSTDTGGASSARGPLRLVQLFGGLAVLNVLFQFVTAGQLFGRGASVEVHGGGAIVLHVVSGVAAIAAGLLAWRDRRYLRLGVLAVAVFLATFVQAALGGWDSLWIHVPGAMVLTGGVVWLFLSALRAPVR